MSIGLVDWSALGLPLLDHIFGPTPALATTAAGRTAHENFLVDEMVWQSQWVMDNPNQLDNLIVRWHQYGGATVAWRLYYSTGQTLPVLLNAANRTMAVFRDGLIGFDPDYYDSTKLALYSVDPENPTLPAGGYPPPSFGNPSGEAFAAYSIVNPGLEAAASRKTKDIVKYFAAAYWVKYQGHQRLDGSEFAREGGSNLMWAFMAKLLWGGSATVMARNVITGLNQSFTFDQIFSTILTDLVEKHTQAFTGNRSFFGWDIGTSGPGDQRYIGNMNLAGTAAKPLVKADRYFRKISAPDARIYPQLKHYFNWLDFGTCPGVTLTSNPASAIQTGGSQWIPGVGPYSSNAWRGGWRYYCYLEPAAYGYPNNNGVHPETLAATAGHGMGPMAWGYAQDTDSVAKSRYRSRISDAKDGIIRWFIDNKGNPPHFYDPREFTEGFDTWQFADGVLLEADGEGPIDPPIQTMDVSPLNPAIDTLITVTISGGPGNVGDWVALAPVGSSLDTYLPTWKYFANNSQSFPTSGVTAGVVTIQAPPTTGTFEMRFLANDGFTLVPGFTPVLVVVGGGGSDFNATITRTGLPEDPYTVVVNVSPPTEYRVKWYVDNVEYPVAVAGALTKGVGQRYLKDANGKAVYMTGSHNWNNVTEWGSPPDTPGNPPSTFDWNAHLLRLIDEGHSATRMWCLGDFVNYAGTPPGPGVGYRVLFPWARSSTPGSINGGNKYDLNVFHQPYFDRLRNRVLEATSAGITCIVVFFNGYDAQFNFSKNIWHASENVSVNGDVNANGQTEEVYNLSVVPPTLLTIQKNFVHKVIDTLNDIDKVVWEINNESGGFSQGWIEAIIADLRAYESSKPKHHPIMQGYMYAGGTNAQVWGFDTEVVAPGTLAGGGASPDGSSDYTTDPPASSGAKVVVLDTDHIYGVGGTQADIWRAFTRALNPIYMDTMAVDAGLESARDAMGLTALMWRRLRTDLNQMAVQAQGTATPCNTGFCLYKTGDIAEYVAYRPAGGPSPVTLDLSGVGAGVTVSYVWEHPITRATGGAGTVQGGAVRNFTPPTGSDWVLFTRRLDLPYSLFGLTGTTPTQGNLGQGTFVVRADIYEVTGESLLGTQQLTIVNSPPNGAIIWPSPGYIFQPASPTFEPQDFLILQPQSAGVDGVQFRIRPSVGGATVNVGTEITVPETDGTFRHDPFVHNGVYADGGYLIDAVVRVGVTSSVSPSVSVTINNHGIPAVGTRQGRRLRGRLP